MCHVRPVKNVIADLPIGLKENSKRIFGILCLIIFIYIFASYKFWMFSSRYLTIVAKIRALVVTHCLFRTCFNLSDLSTDWELKARNSNIASFRVSGLTSLFS